MPLLHGINNDLINLFLLIYFRQIIKIFCDNEPNKFRSSKFFQVPKVVHMQKLKVFLRLEPSCGLFRCHHSISSDIRTQTKTQFLFYPSPPFEKHPPKWIAYPPLKNFGLLHNVMNFRYLYSSLDTNLNIIISILFQTLNFIITLCNKF